MAEETMEEEISKKFEDYEKQIIVEIQKRLPFAWIHEDIQLISWICMMPLNPQISKNITLWSTLPMVAVVWKKSWRFYFFALKTLLPKVFEEAWQK